MEEYPEHEKLQLIKDKSQLLGCFIEWLQERYYLCKYRESHNEGYHWVPAEYYLAHIDIQRLLAEYFDINYDELMKEKEEMYNKLREQANGRKV